MDFNAGKQAGNPGTARALVLENHFGIHKMLEGAAGLHSLNVKHPLNQGAFALMHLWNRGAVDLDRLNGAG